MHLVNEFKTRSDQPRDAISSTPLAGRSVTIIGGGPTVTADLVKRVAPYPVILVNNSYLLFKDPQLVVAMDRRWWEWHGPAFVAMGHTGITALRPGQHIKAPAKPHIFHKDPVSNYSRDPSVLTGKNSGHAAIQVAVHLGAQRIYLVGFDMGTGANDRMHWHEGHRIPTSEQNYRVRFKPGLENIVRLAAVDGIEISAITPTHADIPATPLETAIKDLEECEENQPHG